MTGTGKQVANYTKATKHDRELIRWLRKAYPDEKTDNARINRLCDETGISHRTAVRWFKESKCPDHSRAFVRFYLEYWAKIRA